MASSNSVINPTFTDNHWVAHINGCLNLDLEQVTKNTTFSIFQVPDSLKSAKPESYTPQLIAIGPLHQFNPDLYPMQTFKLAAAQRSQKFLQLPDFQLFVVQHISKFAAQIRASYDKHLNISDEALAWIAAIDSLFLLEYLRHNRDLVNAAHRKISGVAVLEDLVKLENQVPLFMLTEIMNEFVAESTRISVPLPQLLRAFCLGSSPLELHEEYPAAEDGNEPQHLLDVFYQLIWLKEEKPQEKVFARPSQVRWQRDAIEEVVVDLWAAAKTANIGLIQSVANPLDRVIRLSNTLGISKRLRKAIEEDESTTALIPTASQLKSVGITFGCTINGIRSIYYDTNSKTLFLPDFTWNPICEVVMRNLLAYESMAKTESLVLNGYAEIMSCLVKNAADVKLLEGPGIIFRDEAGEEEIVELFKGIASLKNRRNKTGLEEHVKAVNEHYSSDRKIKMRKMVRKYVKISWDVAKVMAAILLLVMLGVQTFCDVYNCKSSSGVSFPGYSAHSSI